MLPWRMVKFGLLHGVKISRMQCKSSRTIGNSRRSFTWICSKSGCRIVSVSNKVQRSDV